MAIATLAAFSKSRGKALREHYSGALPIRSQLLPQCFGDIPEDVKTARDQVHRVFHAKTDDLLEEYLAQARVILDVPQRFSDIACGSYLRRRHFEMEYLEDGFLYPPLTAGNDEEHVLDCLIRGVCYASCFLINSVRRVLWWTLTAAAPAPFEFDKILTVEVFLMTLAPPTWRQSVFKQQMVMDCCKVACMSQSISEQMCRDNKDVFTVLDFRACKAAKMIQRAWRRCRYDPAYTICCRFVLAGFDEMRAELDR